MTLSAKQQWWAGGCLALAVLLGGFTARCATQDALDAETWGVKFAQDDMGQPITREAR